jgi:hypothetical protein
MSAGFRAGVVFTLTITIISYTWMYFTHVPTQIYIRTEFNFSIISDMDQASRVPNEPLWQAYLKVKKFSSITSRMEPLDTTKPLETTPSN